MTTTAEETCSYLLNKFCPKEPSLDPTNTRTGSCVIIRPRPPDPHFTPIELQNAIAKTNFKSSSGLDGINGRLSKMALTYLDLPIVNLFNACLDHAYFPSAWYFGK